MKMPWLELYRTDWNYSSICRRGRACPNRTGLSVVLLFVSLSVYGCGGGDEPVAPPPDPPRATTVTVMPATVRLPAVGAIARLSAQVFDQNGRVMTGATVGWSSGDASVATVDPAGWVTAVAQGTVTITAAADSASGEARIVVVVDELPLLVLYEMAGGPIGPTAPAG